ncbi:MAG: T9SS type A sorting domain-containing protein [Bacteroidetes bacterium]|nr:T9SS type A sorting domain-containing protein [Bacteroidota bacterium]
MKKTFVLFLMLLILKINSQTGFSKYDSILSNGIYRKYRLYVPLTYTSTNSVPLVFNLHGYTSNSMQQQAYANFMPIADTANFIIVAPDGTIAGGNQFWNAGILPGAPYDVQFLSNLIDSIKGSYNINLDRVYSCGLSNGGIMSYYLACNLSQRIAAIASVAGAMFTPWQNCTPIPARAFPVMEIHGTLDGTVPYAGTGTFVPVDTTVKKWLMYNNCSLSPLTYTVPDINLTDNSNAINYKYLNGNNGASVELYKVFGGSHSWPGAYPIVTNTNEDFNASVEIWRFFRQYKLSQFTGTSGFLGFNKSKPLIKIYPNPANDLLYISALNTTVSSVKIIDLMGKEIDAQNLNTQNTINISNLVSGYYIIKCFLENRAEVIISFIKN